MSTKRHATAFLVIHGIGKQMSFQTLDAFARASWSELEALAGEPLTGKHEVRNRAGWLENYVSLSSPHAGRSYDFYEYFWANRTPEGVRLSDIVQWLVDTSSGASKYYAENDALTRRYGHAGGYWYLKQIGWLMRAMSHLPGYLPVAITSWCEPLIRFFNPLFRWTRQWLIDYIGDIVVYTATDSSSRFYTGRRAILDGAVEELTMLLADPHYDQVIVAGHSLGSAIAYDALNRVNHAMNAGMIDRKLARKIVGLVTFGSPLDKIAFFFREHTAREESLRRQILQHYHSFKAKPLDDIETGCHPLANPFIPLLEHVHWINYWDANDPISGPLDFYAVERNVEVKTGKGLRGAHTAYTSCSEMFDDFLRTFLHD